MYDVSIIFLLIRAQKYDRNINERMESFVKRVEKEFIIAAFLMWIYLFLLLF